MTPYRTPSASWIDAHTRPFGETGSGDWIVACETDGIQLLIHGDAIGHGAEAARVADDARSCVHEALATCGRWEQDSAAATNVAWLLNRSDRSLALRQAMPKAVTTAIVLAIDVQRGLLHYGCAGHPPALLINRYDAERIRLLGGPSSTLGEGQAEGFFGAEKLHRGDLIVSYSDGFSESYVRGKRSGLLALVKGLQLALSRNKSLRSLLDSVGVPDDDMSIASIDCDVLRAAVKRTRSQPRIERREPIRGWAPLNAGGAAPPC